MFTGQTSLQAPQRLEAFGQVGELGEIASPTSSGESTAPTRAGIDAAVGVAAGLAIDRADVHAGAAADAAQDFAALGGERLDCGRCP